MPLPKLESSEDPRPLASSPELEVIHPNDRSDRPQSSVLRARKLGWLLVFVLLGVLSMLCDVAVTESLAYLDLPGEIGRLVSYSEVFGHGVGVALFCLLAGSIDPRGARVAGYLLAHSLGSGLVADVFKLSFARARPHSAVGLVDNFIGGLPHFHNPFVAPLADEVHSFPSGHAATAAGLAIGMTRLYPKGAPLFALFAGLAALQRIVAQAHYPSDCLIAVAVAFATCHILSQRPFRLHERLLGPGKPQLRLANP